MGMLKIMTLVKLSICFVEWEVAGSFPMIIPLQQWQKCVGRSAICKWGK
uniref:Uncharacterized protein n=1 Tax=Rhizophora mucronata TaxID=61149 RepID=A0A2P2NKL4_RHIMU